MRNVYITYSNENISIIAITWLVVKMIIFLFFCGTMIVSVLVYFKKIYQKAKSKELLIFSRYPTPGSTKTRLIPKLGEECASYVQLLMVCILSIAVYFCNHTIAHSLPCVWWLCFFYLFVQSKNGKMLFWIWFYQTSEKNTSARFKSNQIK